MQYYLHTDVPRSEAIMLQYCTMLRRNVSENICWHCGSAGLAHWERMVPSVRLSSSPLRGVPKSKFSSDDVSHDSPNVRKMNQKSCDSKKVVTSEPISHNQNVAAEEIMSATSSSTNYDVQQLIIQLHDAKNEVQVTS